MLLFFINIAHAVTIDNPLGVNSVQDLIGRITGYMYGVAAAISTIMVLIGAFQILTAGGNEVKWKKGKDTIIYTVIGLAIVLLSGGVVSLVSGILGGGATTQSQRSTSPGQSGVDTVPLPITPNPFPPPANPLGSPSTLPS